MSWATRSTISMSTNEAQTTRDGGLRELVDVRALRVFGLGDRLVQVGDVVTMPRHRAQYAVFLQLVTLDLGGEG